MQLQFTKRLKDVRQFLRALGPGLVTGAADDDPAGVATYSMAGAQHGTTLLWTAWFTWPLMAVVQMMCARIAMQTGSGLAEALQKKFGKAVVLLIALALLIANVINIAADLAAMADATHQLSGLDMRMLVVLFGLLIGLAMVVLHYDQITNLLKWLVLALFAYAITAFKVVDNWGGVLRDSFSIVWPHDSAGWAMLVAILGTTISPYLFFWQAAHELEEKRAMSRRADPRALSYPGSMMRIRQMDVGVGTFISNAVMFFIMVTCAGTLHKAGIHNINSASEAAQALVPLVGEWALWLYTIGLVGVGVLAIPTLAGSAAFALAEVFGWKRGLHRQLHQAPAFYAVLLGATLVGVLLGLLDINPLQALLWSAIVNGLLAPPLLVGIILVARDRKLMNNAPSSRLAIFLATITAILMGAAAVGMFIF